jgi:CRISPR/Cas system-associated endoribonuclease Cas2
VPGCSSSESVQSRFASNDDTAKGSYQHRLQYSVFICDLDFREKMRLRQEVEP